MLSSIFDHTQKGVYHTQDGNETDLAQLGPSIGRPGRRIVRQGPAARPRGPLFGNPGRSFYANEVIGLARSGTGAVQRELARLEASGLVRVTRLGKQKHYQANSGSPIFNEVRALVLKTVALTDVLRPALAEAGLAFIYGSIAKGDDTASSDIDLMVVSDRLAYADLFAALEKASTELGRKIAPTIYSSKEFTKRVKQGNAFVKRVLAQPKLWLIGNDSDLAA